MERVQCPDTARGGLLAYGDRGPQTADFVGRVAELAGAARAEHSPRVARRFRHAGCPPGEQHRFELLAQLELTGIINGWPPHPARIPDFEWLIAALRAHPDRTPSTRRSQTDHSSRRLNPSGHAAMMLVLTCPGQTFIRLRPEAQRRHSGLP